MLRQRLVDCRVCPRFSSAAVSHPRPCYWSSVRLPHFSRLAPNISLRKAFHGGTEQLPDLKSSQAHSQFHKYHRYKKVGAFQTPHKDFLLPPNTSLSAS